MAGQAGLVTLERRPDGVALVTIDNPPVNALTTPLFAELLAITEELTASPPGAVVLAGRPKVFALGGEISKTYRVRFAGRTDIGDAELDDAVRTVTERGYIQGTRRQVPCHVRRAGRAARPVNRHTRAKRAYRKASFYRL